MSEQAAKRIPIIAMGFAVVALVVVLIAVVVVMNRGSGDAEAHAPIKTAVASTAPIDQRVEATDVVKLDSDDAIVAVPGGVRVKDPALAKKLGLTTDDLIASISGRAVSRQFDVHDVIFNTSMMKVTTLYVELGGEHRIIRWQLDGDLRSARYSLTPSPTYGGLFGGYPGSTPPIPDPLLDTIERVDDTHFSVPRATRDAIFAAPATFTKGARMVPAVKNGAPEGVKLYAVRPSSLFAHIGLQNGDTVESINGVDLGDFSKAAPSFPKLKDAHEFTLVLMRRGRPLTITITEK